MVPVRLCPPLILDQTLDNNHKQQISEPSPTSPAPLLDMPDPDPVWFLPDPVKVSTHLVAPSLRTPLTCLSIWSNPLDRKCFPTSSNSNANKDGTMYAPCRNNCQRLTYLVSPYPTHSLPNQEGGGIEAIAQNLIKNMSDEETTSPQ